MLIEQEIREKVTAAFSSTYLELINESGNHNVPSGSESHFKLTLVSDEFLGKRLLQRHQFVYGLLQEQMEKIHALALHLYTEEEWSKRSGAPASPKCHGGE